MIPAPPVVPRSRPRAYQVGIPARRIVYLLLQGGGHSNPNYEWRWSCPVCSENFTDTEKETAQQMADAHECGGGWCPIPATHLSQPSTLVPRFTVTKEDRERWARRRELAKIAMRTADRVVPLR